MNIKYVKKNGENIAVISSDQIIIKSVDTALDLIMTIKYESGVGRIVINKNAIDNKFFILSSGLAGEILQKFINYQVKFAVYGDYSQYTSKPLKDFIYEANQGKDFFFVDTEQKALQKLSEK